MSVPCAQAESFAPDGDSLPQMEIASLEPTVSLELLTLKDQPDSWEVLQVFAQWDITVCQALHHLIVVRLVLLHLQQDCKM